MGDFATLRDTLALEHYAERLPILHERAAALRKEYRAVKWDVEQNHRGKWTDELYAVAYQLQDVVNEIDNIERDIPIRQQRLGIHNTEAA